MDCVLKKRVSFHDTDCMGVVHHSVYAKFFEEARVEWLYKNKLEGFHAPKIDFVLALLDLQISYLRPLRLADEFEVHLNIESDSSRFSFTYEIWCEGVKTTTGKTLHVGLNSALKVVKPPKELLEGLRSQK